MPLPGPEQVQVLFEDNHLLVVNKPALLPTMGAAEHQNSLHRWACDYLRQKHNKPGRVYVGIVSRLDSHTTGAIVLARTSKAAARLSDQIRRGTVQKRYLAMIPAGLEPTSGWLVDRLVKSESQHRMRVVPAMAPNVSGEKQAELTYVTRATVGDMQLLDIDLQTGRKHQIRVQLQHAGHPIIGDRKYGSSRAFPTGIALHCCQLSFLHPTLKTLQSVRVAPPNYWPGGPLKNLPKDLRKL